MDNDVTKSQTVSVSKSYISHLENELNQEKVARLKLQNDIEQIKQINSEISEKLGIRVDKWAVANCGGRREAEDTIHVSD